MRTDAATEAVVPSRVFFMAYADRMTALLLNACYEPACHQGAEIDRTAEFNQAGFWSRIETPVTIIESL